MYIPIFINKFRLVGLLDSGSDICIISKSVINKLGFTNIPPPKEVLEITSFSGNHIKVIGMINCLVKLHQGHKGISVDVHIINDIPNIPTVLLGNTLLMAGVATLGFTGRPPPYHEPTVQFTVPELFKPTVFYKQKEELYSCKGRVSLEPFEKSEIIMYLDQGAPVVRTDYVLISGCFISDISIIPSRTDIVWDNEQQCFVGTACVVNLTEHPISNYLVTGKFELVNRYCAVVLEGTPAYDLKRLVSLHPLGREILPTDEQSTYRIPTMEVNAIDIHSEPLTSVNDEDMSEAIFSKSPEYTGEANLDPKIIDPSGIDFPTKIYNTAEEAVQLHKFPANIRPFIKEIFVDKYPQVVSLHSLDAGNLSLTLGFTQLRLRKGEVLPRSRRIFHVSPGDQRHMDDITDLLVKFGYICRSPTSPTGHHLYGMSSYLIPRAKPGC
jgi:hypothetical protein